jgi:hypothetical protein
VTLTPSSWVGNLAFTKSEFCHVRESPAGARFAPLICTHIFGAMAAPPPSAFLASEIAGPYAIVKSDYISTTGYGFQVESV